MLLKDFLKDKGLDEVPLDNVVVCKDCGTIFLWHEGKHYDNLPKRCPTCLDKVQKRPSVVQERTELHRFEGVEIVSLPSEWEKVETGVETDYPKWKICFKGRTFGASWRGRIDIFADETFYPGNIVEVHVMKTAHLVLQYSKWAPHIPKSPFDEGTHLVVKNVDINTPRDELPQDATVKEVVETREYIVLEKGSESSGKKLVWETAHTKTTLKGYGRQYHAYLDAASTYWYKGVKGGYRSGRASTEGVLAIVDEEHPLIRRFSEGGVEEVTYIIFF